MACTNTRSFQQATPLSMLIKVEDRWEKIQLRGSLRMSFHLTILYNPDIIENAI